MNRFLLIFFIMASSVVLRAQELLDCKEWNYTDPIQLHLPVFAEKGSVDGKVFDEALLLENSAISEYIQKNLLQMDDSFSVPVISSKNQLVVLQGYVFAKRWIDTKLNIISNGIYEVYLDGDKCKTVSKISDKQETVELKLQTGKHQICVKALSLEDKLSFQAKFTGEEKYVESLEWSVDPQRSMTINDIQDGLKVENLSISSSGEYAILQMDDIEKGTGTVQKLTQLMDLNSGKVLCKIRNLAYNVTWLPNTDCLSYLVKKDNTISLFVYDIKSGEEKCVSDNIGEMQVIKWSPKEDFIILSKIIKAEEPGDLKRVFGNDDRMMPGYRDRVSLYYLDVKSGLIQALTAGYLSANLNDIKPDGSAVLFSTREMDYQTPPFEKQNLYELNVKTFKLDTIWKDKLYGGVCQYSPDGKNLLVVGPSQTFGDMGINITNNHLPNSFDYQMYIYDLDSKQAKVLTHNFPYAINSAKWYSANTIYTSVTERDSINLYSYSTSRNKFQKIDLPVEVLGKIDFAKDKNVALFNGTSISTPEKVYAINLDKNNYKEIAYPKKETYSNVRFGKTEHWEFKNKNGATIDGRVYYPVNYDSSKKYPLIVYYYGGTVPTERNFGGRYPKNIWTANGYMVYVLQPSGATGYGQNFSALHVNGWGKDAIDDIIDGTKEFLKTHPSADPENVGCIGASYGGYTTMMLQTRTDIFKTAIAHAGISDITSYWGEGFWGYSYSSAAATYSYPWNRKDIYVDNSPLFNADKFQNSILLLHGTSDTNVPLGESLQYYAALKILGKDVEMVLIDGEDHHILDYNKRIKWNDTIIAWFDKVLKNQPEQWNDMFPDKKL